MITGDTWLLLVHHIPPQPPYLRAKVMRRLTKIGALALKRSAYLLPANEGALEDFQWLRREIQDEGGDAWIVEARFAAGLADDDIRQRFRALRSNDYRALAAEARSLLDRARDGSALPDDPSIEADRRRLVRRLDATRGIDFFHAEDRDEVEALMATIERTGGETTRTPTSVPGPDQLRGRTWVTRTGVKVDRMASAWLIRRFIDPAATFAFVAPDQASSIPNALCFDMFEGEFTHDGNRCTFEVLRDVSAHARDRGLAAIGQIVHDLDLRDDRYQRAETAGVAALLDGIMSRTADDHRRIAESSALFDALYASLGPAAHRRSPAEHQ